MPHEEGSEDLDLRLKDFYSLEDRHGGDAKVEITLASLREALKDGARTTAVFRCREFCRSYTGSDDKKGDPDEDSVTSTNDTGPVDENNEQDTKRQPVEH